MSDEVDGKLLAILREDLAVKTAPITHELHLVDDLGLDSVAFAIGKVAIEERLGVALSGQELLECLTVGDLQDIVRSKAADSLPAAVRQTRP